MTQTDIQFQIECLTTEMADSLAKQNSWDVRKVLDTIYSSDTYRKVCDPRTGLFYESSVYVLSMLEEELQKSAANQLTASK